MRRSVESTNLCDADGELTGQSTRIECHIDLKAYFHETLSHALAARKVEAPAPTEFYLVGLLTALGHDTAALSRSLVELSFDVQGVNQQERLARLRSVGDQALSIMGLFDAHIERRGISRSYLGDLGSRAYRTASQLARSSRESGARARAQVFHDLGAHFRTYADVLEDVREATALGTPDDVLSLYERFCKTKSPAVAERLLSHGVVSVSGNNAPESTEAVS
jgi:hypothetical protein